MRNRFGSYLRIGVSPDGVVLARATVWRPGRLEVVAQRVLAASADLDEVVVAVRETLAAVAPAGACVSLVLSDELVRMWLVHPPPLCNRQSDLHAAAAQRFQLLFGAPPADWNIAADWSAAHPFLAVAVPQRLLSTLYQVVREHHGHVVRIESQFVAAINQWSRQVPRGAWLGLSQLNVLRLALFDGGSLAAVRCVHVPAEANREWLENLVEREALLVGVERPTQLYLCGAAPETWAGDGDGRTFSCDVLGGDARLSELERIACTGNLRAKRLNIDFASPSIRRVISLTPVSAWTIAAVALATLSLAVPEWGNYARELSRYRAQLATMQVHQRMPAGAKRPAKPGLAPAQAAAINAAIMQLNLPWREMHDAVQSATPAGVALLTLEPDAKKGVVLITGETKNSDDMAAFVEQMQGQREFAAVTLTRHEVNEQDPVRPIRFQLQARWREQ